MRLTFRFISRYQVITIRTSRKIDLKMPKNTASSSEDVIFYLNFGNDAEKEFVEIKEPSISSK